MEFLNYQLFEIYDFTAKSAHCHMMTHLNKIEEKLEQKLSCISFDIFKIKLNTHNVISNIDALKKELEKLNEIKDLNTSCTEKLSFQADKLNGLNRDILVSCQSSKI